MKKIYLMLTVLFCVPGFAQNPNWHSLGPVNMPAYMGRVNCISARPGQPDTLFVGTPGGGVWRSDDGGATWVPRLDFLPVLGVSAIVIDPSNPDTVYIATGDADAGVTPSIGVWKSTNGGTDWANTGLSWSLADGRQIYNLIMTPGNSQQLFAATTDGIYKTSDGGTTWQRTTPGGNTWCYDVQFKPGSSTVVYVTCKGANFFRSTDAGANWSQVTTGLPTDGVDRSVLGVSPNSSSGLYILYGDSGNGDIYGLYRSTDSGVSFSKQAGNVSSVGGNHQQGYDLTLAVSPTDFQNVAAGEYNIGASTDGGATWPTVTHDGTTGIHIDVHKVAFLNGVLFACTDGGIHKTLDGGAHWVDLSPTLQIAQIYKFYGAPQDSSLIYVGEQDNGLDQYSGGTWSRKEGGDFDQPIVDPTDENIVYAMAFGYYYKTTNAWDTYTFLNITSSEGGGSSLTISPADGKTLFAGYQNVWKTTDGGDTWSPISSFGDQASCSAIILAPSNPSYIYAIRGGEVWRTIDDGANWVKQSIPVSGTATALAVSSSDPNHVWLAQNDSSANKIYVSADGGTNWSAFTGSLPNRRVTSIVYEGGSNDGLYAGFDAGIYYRNAALSDWQPFNTALPNSPVTDLQIEYSSLTLRAATFGRGLWETYLYGAAPVPPALTGPDVLGVNQTGHYSFAPITKAFGYQWRQRQQVAFNFNDGAEAGLVNFTATTSSLYPVIANDVAASGNSSFHLAHPTRASQLLTMNRSFVPTANGQLEFKSRLGVATSTEEARVQLSTDGGHSWLDLYSQFGTDDFGEGAFIDRSFSLAAYAGQVLQLRFRYDVLGGSYFNQLDPGVGWYIDDVVITGAVELDNPVVTDIDSATSFNFSSGQAGDYVLDARAKVYGGYSLDWGPVKSVSVSVSPPTPFLTITQSGDNLRLNWADTSFQLQTTPTLNPANWTTVPGTPPLDVPRDPAGAFFRLIK